jgi:hypothetical protein
VPIAKRITDHLDFFRKHEGCVRVAWSDRDLALDIHVSVKLDDDQRGYIAKSFPVNFVESLNIDDPIGFLIGVAIDEVMTVPPKVFQKT